MKTVNRNSKPESADPQIKIGGLTMRRSKLKRYLQNFVDNAKITLFENARTNKTNYTWVKKNLLEIVNAVYDE